ncbi:TPA: hypothetical protein ACH3X2_010739 [Trebouxia sp. C0005]
MGVPYHMLVSLCSHVRAYHKQIEQHREQQAQTHQLPQSGQLQQQEQAHHLELELQQQQHQHQQHHHHQSQQQHPQRGIRKGQTHTEAASADAVRAVPPAWECKGATAAVAADLDHDEAPASALAQGLAVCSDCELPCDQSTAVMHSNGAVQVCHGIRAVGFGPNSRVVQLPDMSLLKELVQTGKGTKALRDSMDACEMTYGQLRLTLAHLYCLLRNSVCQCS